MEKGIGKTSYTHLKRMTQGNVLTASFVTKKDAFYGTKK